MHIDLSQSGRSIVLLAA